MSRKLYSLLLYLLAPFLLVWMALRARKAGGKWDVFSAKRFGRNYKDKPASKIIWVHAVSLGETRAAQPLIQLLLDKQYTVLLTHLTATGWAEGERVYASAIAANQLQQAWLPYDFPCAVKGFLKHYQPTVAILIEREIWPNMVHTLIKRNIPVILASARMSARSLRRTLRFGSLMTPCYRGLTHVYAQSLQDARRLEIAGAKRVCVSGNFKFDIQPDQAKQSRGHGFGKRLGRRVIAIASTREGEDKLFIQAIDYQLKRMHQLGVEPELQPLFLLIPRHPQRFEQVGKQIAEQGLRQVSRTELIELGDDSSSAVSACQQAQIVLGNSLGEMPWYYGMCDVAIVAGSFAPLGGQNFIEASAIGRPVIVGPHTANFAQAVNDALAAEAIIQVQNQEEAIKAALNLLEDCAQRNKMSEQASYWVGQHAGAVARVFDGVNQVI